MNIQFQKVIEGLKRHAGMLDYGCWKPIEDDKDSRFECCPYFDKDRKGMGCGRVLLRDAVELLEKYDEALKLIKVIPIEWLEQKYRENDPDSGNEDFDRYLWDSICYVLTAWYEEQGEEDPIAWKDELEEE